MANATIPDLDTLPVPVTGTELFETSVSGTSYKVTLAALAPSLAVYNGTGGTLAAGTLVYLNGWNAANSVPTIAKADTDLAGAIASYVVTGSLSDATVGTVCSRYLLSSIDTSGASAVGSPVYLDTTAGGYTLTAPTGAAARVQVVGQVTAKNASTGAIQFDTRSQGVTSFGTSEFQALSVTLAKMSGTHTQHGVATYGAADLAVVAPGATGNVLKSDGTDWTAGTLTSTSFAANAVVTAAIASKAVTVAKTLVSLSTVLTANGSAQNFAHGLGATPSIIIVTPVDTTDAGIIATGFATSYTADATNVAVTGTTGLKYTVTAWA